MKINKIVIRHYKNLVDCSIDFARCGGVAVIAGINGSGKSNFLEALSLALLHIKQPYSVYPGDKIEYALDYELDGQCIGASWKAGESEIIWSGVPDGTQPAAPRRVVAMYSGEFSRLSECGFDPGIFFGLSGGMALLSANDFPAALLFFALKDKGNLAGLAGFGDVHQNELMVSYRITNASMFLQEEPQDEFQGILYDLAENSFTGETRHEIAVSEFLSVVAARLSIDNAGAELVVRNLVGDPDGYSPVMTDVVFSVKDSGEIKFCQDDLSEGEKRLIMLKYIYEALADDRTVVLLDEPDAHIHESKKLDVFDMITASVSKGCTTVMTTHSTSLIEHVPANNLVCFDLEDGAVKVRQDVDFDVIANLTDSRLSFFSTRPIMLFEGKSDIYLLSNAMDALRRLYPEKYGGKSLLKQFDLYLMGGTGNAVAGLELFREKFPKRKIVVVLDGDDGGVKAYKAILKSRGLTEPASRSADGTRKMTIDSNTTLLIPPPPNGVSGEYAIEDYIDKTYLNSRVQSYLANSQYRSFTSMPRIKAELKTELGNRVLTPRPPDPVFSGFQPIIDCLLAQ